VRLETVRALIALNNRFYAENAATFSSTRNAPWQGWHEVLCIAREQGALRSPASSKRVLDLAAGNLRFERFLAEEVHDPELAVTAVDNCPDLLDGARLEGLRCTHVELDVIDALLAGGRLPAAGADLAVCFGFAHHVPTAALRARLVRALVDAVRPGGVIALSFWQFMDDPRLARQAARVEARAPAGLDLADLEPGDHLLGWQGSLATARYCHHIDELEIDSLVRDLKGVRELARFFADGASGRLNRYLILQQD